MRGPSSPSRAFILFPVLLLSLAALSMPAAALTYSDVPREALPVLNIYDPQTHENEDITTYSFEELDAMFLHPRFRTWNDLDKVCQSMELMFGRVSGHCAGFTPMGLPPRTARAYVSFEIVPPPRAVHTHPLIVMTDPITPPWAPTYQQYRWDDPYSRGPLW